MYAPVTSRFGSDQLDSKQHAHLKQTTPPPERSNRDKVNLPPSIQRSLDGEEGYVVSQLRLHQSTYDPDLALAIHPPPNRTAYESSPPPPYRSNSLGLLHPPAPGTAHSHAERSDSPLVVRCYSMSTRVPPGGSNSFTCSSLSSSPHFHGNHCQATNSHFETPPNVSLVQAPSANKHRNHQNQRAVSRHLRCGSTSSSSSSSGSHQGLSMCGAPPEYSDVMRDCNRHPDKGV
jgi:hypothetical protein